ncbi:MAG: transposase [Candidatus Babeliales bacterium]|nr:transposase [Candidatus Babeliales bacterium]
MKILEQALNKINLINKKQKDFFIILIQSLIGSVGKKTFRNLARYAQITEHTFGRQMAKMFDFAGLNTELLKASIGDGDVLLAAQDASFIPKSGKSTEGIDYFWNGCAGKTEKGLELDTIAIIKLNGVHKDGYTLSAKQTPANTIPKSERKKKITTEPTRIDFYLDHVKSVASHLLDLGVKYIAVDAFYAKIKYVSGVIVLGFHVISKMRIDARLLRIYDGPQKARGRKRKTDKSKVKAEDFTDSEVVKIDDGQIELRSGVMHSVSLGRSVKVVWVKKLIGPNKYGEAFLFSTDTEMEAIQIYQYYVARFQIEFIFRDAKGFTGLTDCQSRDARRLHYHFNASLVALNLAKLQDNEIQKNEQTEHAFSMTNWARQYHVGIVIERFISMLGLDQTLIKLHPDYENMLSFGNVKH